MNPPLVPAFVDLRDFAFMPLKVLRLRDSDLATYSSGDEFKAAVLLWCAAWHQVPAGTLPNDDKWLAKHSGAGLGWKKMRAGSLRGWTARSDGRLHHEVLAEVAIESWNKKIEQRLKTLKARIAKAQHACDKACEPVDKRSLAEAVTALKLELSQLESMAVTGPVTGSKRSEVEVKGRSSKPALERTPDIPSTAEEGDGTNGRVDKALNGKGKTVEKWGTLAWASATAQTLDMPRVQGESDDIFIDRVCVAATARVRHA